MAEFLRVNEVLENLDLNESMAAAEFGCGSAVFTLALAQKLRRGTVYALDIQEEKLSALQGKAMQQDLQNIKTLLVDLEAARGSTLSDNSLDVVLVPNMLFQAENKAGVIAEAKRVLKAGGQLVIVDWLKKTPFSPAKGMVSPEDIKTMARQMDLGLRKEFAAGDYHFGLVFTKK